MVQPERVFAQASHRGEARYNDSPGPSPLHKTNPLLTFPQESMHTGLRWGHKVREPAAWWGWSSTCARLFAKAIERARSQGLT
jgi:hypothetical protein